MKTILSPFKTLALVPTVLAGSAAQAANPGKATPATRQQPHIIIIYTDDMGIGDLSCYNNGWTQTPNIDRLAASGITFNHYYTASPVSSPSRVALTTGMFPTEWGINTFLNDRAANARCEQFDFLDPSAPSMARALKEAGYRTGHIGKWHMGGGRDVDNAPQITEYGFDEYLTTYEGPDPDPRITATHWIWSEQDEIPRWNRTAYFVDRTLEFLANNAARPCFVNLWPDDMHDPWVPYSGYYGKNDTWSSKMNFMLVLEEYDRQIGRLIEGLERLGLRENTLVIFTSDNGAAPTFDQVRTNAQRGAKNSLYEGGIHMPFIVSWPARIPAGGVDNESVICSVDLFPSLCAIAGGRYPERFEMSGEDVSPALLGQATHTRSKDLLWDFGRNRFFNRPGAARNQSPHLAIRRGDMKVIVQSDGTNLQLFDIRKDPNESVNIAARHPELARELSAKVIDWYTTKRVTRE